MTKKVGDRHWAVLQAFAFLREYGALRGCAQASLGPPQPGGCNNTMPLSPSAPRHGDARRSLLCGRK